MWGPNFIHWKPTTVWGWTGVGVSETSCLNQAVNKGGLSQVDREVILVIADAVKLHAQEVDDGAKEVDFVVEYCVELRFKCLFYLIVRGEVDAIIDIKADVDWRFPVDDGAFEDTWGRVHGG